MVGAPTSHTDRDEITVVPDEVTVTVDEEHWTDRRGGRLELAQVVWLRALDRPRPAGQDEMEDALALVKLARNHRAVLEHALSHGRALLQRRSDVTLARAVRDLERALSLVRPGDGSVIPRSHVG